MGPYRAPAHLPSQPAGRPRLPPPHLRLLPSPYRGEVLCCNRVTDWLPFQSRRPVDGHGRPLPVSQEEIDRLQRAIGLGWELSTRTTYGTGLLYYMVWADKLGLSEEARAPASKDMIELFISDLIGFYSASAISNAVQAVRAWHILHGLGWPHAKDDFSVLLSSAEKNCPPSSRRPQRQPVRIELIRRLHATIDFDDPADVAFYACLTTVYFSTSRLGEFVLGAVHDHFDPARHVSRGCVKEETDGRNVVWSFRLPRTKVAIKGETVSWAPRPGDLADPRVALQRHLDLNHPTPDHHPLFAYRDAKARLTPMTRARFLTRLKAKCAIIGETTPHGHALRIGNTLEMLLDGVPFEVVKTKGRWSSDTFQVYLRKHELILAPYIQALPELQSAVARVTMPRITRRTN
jgi:hypothetical protein